MTKHEELATMHLTNTREPTSETQPKTNHLAYLCHVMGMSEPEWKEWYGRYLQQTVGVPYTHPYLYWPRESWERTKREGIHFQSILDQFGITEEDVTICEDHVYWKIRESSEDERPTTASTEPTHDPTTFPVG